MAKLCPRGKAAAKRKFKVYPSAYANMYASAVCSGKVTPGGKKKNRKKAMGGGSMNTRIGLKHGSYEKVPPSKGFSKYVTKQEQKKIDAANKEANEESKKSTNKARDSMADQVRRKALKQSPVVILSSSPTFNKGGRVGRRGGGLMEATARLQRQGLKGGGICKKGMNRKAVGKNS